MSDHSRDKSYAGYLGGIKKKIFYPFAGEAPATFHTKYYL